MKKILVVNGGGSAGLISILLLKKIETELNIKIFDEFDMFAGTSVGAIITSYLANGYGVPFISLSFYEFLPKIFGNPEPFWKIWKSKYDSKILERCLKEYLNFPMSEVKKDLMINTINISKPKRIPKFFKSWNNESTLLYQIVTASCSAPTFFNPYKIDNDYHVDGGFAINNISSCVIAELIRRNINLNDIKILNLSYTLPNGYDNPEKMKGIWHWITKLPELYMGVTDPIADYQCKYLLGQNYVSIDTEYLKPLDDLNISEMEKVADREWNKHKETIINFF
jgi:hypothetical protein